MGKNKRKNDQSSQISNLKEKEEVQKKVQKRKMNEISDNSEDYEDFSEEELQEEIKNSEMEIQNQEKSKKKSKKSVKFREQLEDDLKEDLDVHDLQYEDDNCDDYEEEEIENQEDEMVDENGQKKKLKPFMGTEKDLQEGEELDYDNRAYEMFHRANVEWPCLSIDFLLPGDQPYYFQNPGFQTMNNYPYELYLTAGTQSGTSKNYVYLMKMSNLQKTKYDDDSDYQDSDDGKDDDEPIMRIESTQIEHNINRIRSLQHMPIVAFWQDNGYFSIMDMKQKFDKMVEDKEEFNDNQTNRVDKNNSLDHMKSNIKHFKNEVEGYALDWSYLKRGFLLSGSCDGKVYLYHPKNENFSDIVRTSQPYTIHNGSVEDLQWSTIDETQFASCSTDGTVQITDIRVNNKSQSQIKIKASSSDINVISWCRTNSNLLASGADNGEVFVWDKRYPTQPYSEITFHKEAITSIQFQPNDETTLAVSSADNRMTIWDFSCEANDNQQDLDQSIPDQLMFVHQGQQDMKELRYHPIYHELIVSTALNGINIFKPMIDENESSIRSEQSIDDGQIPQIDENELNARFGNLTVTEDKQ